MWFFYKLLQSTGSLLQNALPLPEAFFIFGLLPFESCYLSENWSFRSFSYLDAWPGTSACFSLCFLLLGCRSTNCCNPQVIHYKMLSHYLRPSLSVLFFFGLLPFEPCYLSENWSFRIFSYLDAWPGTSACFSLCFLSFSSDAGLQITAIHRFSTTKCSPTT